MKRLHGANMFIFNLTCENAGGLGGPMGTEYTTHVFTKPFASLEKAKAYAVKYQGKKYWPEYADWESDERGIWYVDSSAYIFTIKKEKVS